MKLIASSRVPVRVPYLHVAYLVASAGPKRAAEPGLTGLAIGLAMLVTVFPLTSKSYRILKVLTRTVVCIVAAYFLLTGGFRYLRYRSERYGGGYWNKTRGRIQLYGKSLRKESVSPETDIEGILKLNRRRPVAAFVRAGRMWPEEVVRVDAWDTAIMIEPTKKGFRILSAGRDGVFDTEDDLFEPGYGEIMREDLEAIAATRNAVPGADPSKGKDKEPTASD